MIVKEETLELLEEAVANGQFRLADTRFLDVLAELLEVVAEMKYKLDAIEEFLTTDEDEDNSENTTEEEKQETVVTQKAEVIEEIQVVNEEKPKQKSKAKQTEELETKE
jgi:hypothetical protein